MSETEALDRLLLAAKRLPPYDGRRAVKPPAPDQFLTAARALLHLRPDLTRDELRDGLHAVGLGQQNLAVKLAALVGERALGQP